MTERILIVDDEKVARENLQYVLKKEGYHVVAVDSGFRALKELERTEFDLVMTDLRMERVDGMDVLERTKELWPQTEVIVVTGYATVATAVEAMKKGAYHYLPKPYKLEEVRILVRKALERRELEKEVQELRRQVRQETGGPVIIGKSDKMHQLLRLAEQIAPTDTSVLILGETGTGKELVARFLHAKSQRGDRPFLAINCGAFSEELLANELFGHEKEAFTGAGSTKKGLLEAAHGGTVFLDEIGEMPPAMQVKLLRVLQEKKLIRVGGTEEIPVDIRVVAATNRNLLKEVKRGRFRQDLFYRINVITLYVPPLVERRDDIPLLCRHFLDKFARAQQKEIAEISEEVLEVLMQYEFPGNVRELENIVERAVALAQGDRIEVNHLPPDLQQLTLRVPRPARREFLTLEEYEKEYILWVLKKVKGNKTKAAEILGIDRVSLWRRLKRFGVQ
ncbi:DNA-binding transcriptional response regulator, NtrC family, contains REC, AAA-type ATPase, and a Fis-type DNA-binding domains [Desulfacinum hydrothermale DSM 13146]|uniref:DNA-binding transcriptional response regulator, NtrC family, contains REC, AAA-type ATPase, and a Fis-type DNA-binding domains n=1 Tax=Desulfacinum hydrothermale DSM 13146 TaxID=1121390 RepID=A0A1W1XTS0_9BACT|nr:sigma-54 dependent transcriptional regulator [Desulfacinum hydrothermale]SMC27369.1 DNA-binding transcriptional response regulator, NtrC family, contains REC, AAA-type ATPase, and a Fis-type DNA-binding domains [Desulfacinum hydrothermale DSM 13146]